MVILLDLLFQFQTLDNIKMKKSILLLIVFIPVIGWGQNTDWEKPSWWNKGKIEQKGKVGEFHETEKSLWADSTLRHDVFKKLIVIRQDYSLYNKKRDVYYGYNDCEFFGTTYSLGIKCYKFTLLFDEAVHPWNYDSKYLDFKDRKLTPKITKTQFVLLDDSTSYNFSEMDSVLVENNLIKENSLYIADPLTSLQDGIYLNTADTCKNGLLVWVVKESGEYERGNVLFDLRFVPFQAEMAGTIPVTPPSDCKDILGCLYITESVNKDIPYYLSGIATLQNKLWQLCFPFKDFKLGLSKDEKKSKEKGRLTEIRKPKKK